MKDSLLSLPFHQEAAQSALDSQDGSDKVLDIFQRDVAELSGILAQVKDAAINHQQYLLRNESATRQSLVDPVLRALGWDIAK